MKQLLEQLFTLVDAWNAENIALKAENEKLKAEAGTELEALKAEIAEANALIEAKLIELS